MVDNQDKPGRGLVLPLAAADTTPSRRTGRAQG